MSFKDSFASFNRDNSSATARNASHIKRPGATPAQPARSSTPVDLKRKRDDLPARPGNATFSQPSNTGSGSEILTNVVYAVDYLKDRDTPVSWDDLWSYLSVAQDLQHNKPFVKRGLQGHDRVEYLANKDAFRYRPVHDVRSAEELKRYLQIQATAQGLSVKELKDGWPAATEAIEQLEREGWCLVTRNKKDNTPKLIWPNNPDLSNHVDDDFQNFWHKIKVPANAEDVRIDLDKAGLTPTSQIKEKVIVKTKEKKKRAPRKGGKTTNTHMEKILKDYSGTRK